MNQLKARFNCYLCPKTYLKRGLLQSHFVTFHNGQPFTCSFCPATYKSVNAVKVHERQNHPVHFQPDVVTRNASGHKAKPVEELMTPRLHHDDYMTCAWCSESFPSMTSLRFHVTQVHRNPDKKKAQDHEEPMTIEENFPCTFCTKIYPIKSSLRRHMAKNHESPYKAMRKQKIKVSLTGPSHEESVDCTWCDKTFPSTKSLRLHMFHKHKDQAKKKKEMSTDPKVAFPCVLCNESFHSSYSLKIHVDYMHTSSISDERSCPVCGQDFNSSKSLKDHIIAKHYNNVDPTQSQAGHSTSCPYCSRLFLNQRGVQIHMYRTHKDLYKKKNKCENSSKQQKVKRTSPRSTLSQSSSSSAVVRANETSSGIQDSNKNQSSIVVSQELIVSGSWADYASSALKDPSNFPNRDFFSSSMNMTSHNTTWKTFSSPFSRCITAVNVKREFQGNFQVPALMSNHCEVQCPFCNELFRGAKSLILHLQVEHEEDDENILSVN